MTRLRSWWYRKVRPWLQRNRADRQMPTPIGRWPAGSTVTVLLHRSLSSRAKDRFRSGVVWWTARIPSVALHVRDATEGEAWAAELYGLDGVPRGAILVRVRAPLVAAKATHELQHVDGILTRGEVRLSPDAQRDPRLRRIALHELGHGLGLGDIRDGDPELLMTTPGGTGCELLPTELAWVRG